MLPALVGGNAIHGVRVLISNTY